MASADRFRVGRTPEGGVSIGFSAIATYLNCNELLRWTYIEGGDGIEPQAPESKDALWYGKLWHGLYQGRVMGQSDADVWAALVPAEVALSYGLSEMTADMDWYFDQVRSMRVNIVACEVEMAVPVGVHVLRGTPDLVAEVEADWGGGTYIIDHKTYVAVSYDKRGYMRLNTRPPDAAYTRNKHSRQFPFYTGLVERALGRKVDGCLVNFVPQRVNWALAQAAERGKSFTPAVVRDFIFPNDDTVAETWDDALRAAGQIAAMPPEGPWAHNNKACITQWGGTCAFIDLCEAKRADRPALIAAMYQPRVIV